MTPSQMGSQGEQDVRALQSATSDIMEDIRREYGGTAEDGVDEQIREAYRSQGAMLSKAYGSLGSTRAKVLKGLGLAIQAYGNAWGLAVTFGMRLKPA